MKQEGEMFVVACRPMAGVSPVSANSQSQQPFPTPSPFSFSDAPARLSTRPPIYLSNLILRFLALVFSFVSALSLAASSSKKDSPRPSSFADYSELLYCFIASVLVFVYSAFQLFKGICDIAQRGILISDMFSDYMSFILDQVAGYLLISSSSVAILAIQQIDKTASILKAVIISTVVSFVTFLVIVICTLLSGYRLCKRIIW
ncbi:hypothetical protein POPTR_001G102600v4 [Populus trichocarpa]|uniref:CASP-like protein n=2 Tax=Populus TaxID=3689 RepID=A0A2K2BVH7_POPTR|nr:CASP-like protein 4A4 [Populus trichocarpa]KAH8521980.1 hypothetical protein H0E87_002849 [Populus deltoides]PNT53748.1 hypothetical protein POPTR_001G102600v4 [Populus trichocarpa]|eukprot:XP_002299522.2 CASP-like protein 4A4 [Populus trichocarpa]